MPSESRICYGKLVRIEAHLLNFPNTTWCVLYFACDASNGSVWIVKGIGYSLAQFHLSYLIKNNTLLVHYCTELECYSWQFDNLTVKCLHSLASIWQMHCTRLHMSQKLSYIFHASCFIQWMMIYIISDIIVTHLEAQCMHSAVCIKNVFMYRANGLLSKLENKSYAIYGYGNQIAELSQPPPFHSDNQKTISKDRRSRSSSSGKGDDNELEEPIFSAPELEHDFRCFSYY